MDPFSSVGLIPDGPSSPFCAIILEAREPQCPTILLPLVVTSTLIPRYPYGYVSDVISKVRERNFVMAHRGLSAG